jgi:hypothetical protein
MKEYIILHKDQIKELTWNLKSLDERQRNLLREKLGSFASRPLYRRDLVLMLRELRDSGQISKIDFEGLSEILTKLFED